jgi:hypothetical protein
MRGNRDMQEMTGGCTQHRRLAAPTLLATAEEVIE